MQEDLIEHMRFESPQEDITTDISIALNENRATKKLKVCCLIGVVLIMSLNFDGQAVKNNKLFCKYLSLKKKWFFKFFIHFYI